MKEKEGESKKSRLGSYYINILPVQERDYIMIPIRASNAKGCQQIFALTSPTVLLHKEPPLPDDLLDLVLLDHLSVKKRR